MQYDPIVGVCCCIRLLVLFPAISIVFYKLYILRCVLSCVLCCLEYCILCCISYIYIYTHIHSVVWCGVVWCVGSGGVEVAHG